MPQIFTADVSADTSVVNAVETVLATLTGVSVPRPGAFVRLEGHVNMTSGTSTTSFVLRIRRDSLTGAVVSESETDVLAAAVGSSEDHGITVVDTPGEIQGATYVLTIVQTGGAANGTCNHANLTATVI